MENLKINCPKHGITEAYKSKGKLRCKKCRIDAVNNARRERKLYLVNYKGGKCEICGYDKCVGALEFHHLNKDEKSFGVAQKGTCKRLEEDIAEVNKCILVCANCHRELHYIENLEKIEEYNKQIQNNIKQYNTSNDKRYYDDISRFLTKEILENYLKNGKSVKEISEEYCVGVTTIRRYIKKYNIEIENQRKVAKCSKEELEKLILIESFESIGRKFGVSGNAVRKWCKSYGLPFKKCEICKK